jgi:hypothetical protein
MGKKTYLDSKINYILSISNTNKKPNLIKRTGEGCSIVRGERRVRERTGDIGMNIASKICVDQSRGIYSTRHPARNANISTGWRRFVWRCCG